MPRLEPPVRRELWAMAGLLTLAAVFCAPTLRRAYCREDFEVQNIPGRAFIGAGLRAGELRWWAEEVAAGYPIHAESQVGHHIVGGGVGTVEAVVDGRHARFGVPVDGVVAAQFVALGEHDLRVVGVVRCRRGAASRRQHHGRRQSPPHGRFHVSI